MTRQEATHNLRKLLDEQGLSDWHIRVTTDISKPFLGLCDHKNKTIFLNGFSIDTHPDSELLNTIRHEVAHALTPSHQHDDVWRMKAKELGCDNTRECGMSLSPIAIDAIRSGASLEVTIDEEIVRTPHYKVTKLVEKCAVCGKVASEVSNQEIGEMKLIQLQCGHTQFKELPKKTPFHTLRSITNQPCAPNQHIWDRTVCTTCGMMKPYDFQITGMQFLERALALGKGGAIFDEMGLGKSVPVSALVATPSGFRPIGQLLIGDLVISDDGKAHPVTGIFPQGKLDLYHILFSDKTTTTCSGDHLWIVNTPIRKWRKQPNLIKCTNELIDDLYLTAENFSGKKNAKWYIPITAPVEFNSREIKIDPYLLGLLLGDGCLTNSNHITFDKPDNELHEYINWKRSNDRSYTSDKEFIQELSNYQLIGTRANSKFIPEDYKYNSIENRLAILQGLMDTDGSVWNNGVVEYTTVSPELANGVMFLVESLGGTCRLTFKNEPKYEYKGETLIGQMAYRIVINVPINPFRLKRKASLFKIDKKYLPTRAITSIIKSGNEECVCISVDSPNSSFLLEHFIVTHNTIQALGLLKFHPEYFPCLFITPSSIMYQWAKQLTTWLGESYFPQIISQGKSYVFPKMKCYITSYDLLRKLDLTQFTHVKCVVLDEVQKIKNVDSTRTQQVRNLVRDVPNIIELSGTPWKNRGSEFFPALNILNPIKFHSYEGFKNRWVDYYWDGNKQKEGGISDIPRFKEYTSDILIRRERIEVMKELPLVSRNKFYVEIDKASRKVYDESVSDFVKGYNQAIIDGTEDDFATSQFILAQLQRMRHILGLAKIDHTIDFVIQHTEQVGNKIVVFVHHKDVGVIIHDQLKQRLNNGYTVRKLTADMPPDDRFTLCEEFNNTDKIVLIASTLASGEGLNLQTCADCIMHERQWNPQNEEQAEGRFIRIGQQSSHVTATYMHADDSVDTKLDVIVERKRVAFHNSMNKSQLVSWNEQNIIKELAQSIVDDFNSQKGK